MTVKVSEAEAERKSFPTLNQFIQSESMLTQIDPEREKVVRRVRPLQVVKPQGQLRFGQWGNRRQVARGLAGCKACRSLATWRGPRQERQCFESHGF